MLIYAATIAAAIVVIYKRPSAAIGVLLCTYAFEQWTQSQSMWFWQRQSLTNIVTASLLLYALVARALHAKPLIRDLGRDYRLVCVLLAYAMASIAWSVSPSASIGITRAEGLYLITFGLLMPMAASDRRDLRDAFLSLLMFGSVIAVLLLTTASWTSRSIVFASGTTIVAAGSDRGNPLAIGSFGGYVALVAVLYNFRGLARPLQALRYAVAAAGFAVAVKSGSRGQTLAMVLTALVMIPYSRRVRNIGGFAAFGATLLIVGFVGSYVFDAASRGPGDVQDRRWTLDASLDAVQGTRFALATTLLNFWLASGPFRWVAGIGSSGSFAVPGLWFYCHNVPVEVVCELGVAGAALFVAIIVSGYRNARDAWPLVRDDPEARGQVACAIGILLFEFIVGLKEGSLIGSGTMLGMAALLGRTLLSLRREAAERAEVDAAGYAMTDEERFLEDEAYLDELYDPDGAVVAGAPA